MKTYSASYNVKEIYNKTELITRKMGKTLKGWNYILLVVVGIKRVKVCEDHVEISTLIHCST